MFTSAEITELRNNIPEKDLKHILDMGVKIEQIGDLMTCFVSSKDAVALFEKPFEVNNANMMGNMFDITEKFMEIMSVCCLKVGGSDCYYYQGVFADAPRNADGSFNSQGIVARIFEDKEEEVQPQPKKDISELYEKFDFYVSDGEKYMECVDNVIEQIFDDMGGVETMFLGENGAQDLLLGGMQVLSSMTICCNHLSGENCENIEKIIMNGAN